jgi:hypothetical protein
MWRIRLISAAVMLLAASAFADADHCAVCGVALSGAYYTRDDAVTGQKKLLCKDCVKLGTVCFICGMPVVTNYTELPDKRLLCARDAQTAIINDEDARAVCRETKDSMDRLFSRFLDFPDTNVTVKIVDRVHLQEMFKFPGQDYVCPNVWGYMESKTNAGHLEHSINLLSGLPRASFKATCAHEYGHAWLNQNLSARRKKSLGKDANEGFCELVSYMLMDTENEEAQKKVILSNAYTRGQIQLFIEAEQTFGLNDIADWMRYGVDDLLSADNPERVRSVFVPKGPAGYPAAPAVASQPQEPVPEVLTLKGVFMSPNHPEAVINNRSFELNETASVRVGTTNVTIRCLAIGPDFARVKLLDSGEEKELRLKQPNP